jgi:PAS domain S-box-containing protein
MTTHSTESIVKTRTFIVRILAGVLVINAFVVALSGFFLLQSRQQHLNRVESQTENLVTALELTISGIFNKTNLTLLTLVDEAEKQLGSGAIDWNALSKFESRQHSRIPEIGNFRIVRANGDLMSFDDDTQKILINVADLDYFIKHKQDANAGLIFSKPRLSRVTKKWLLIASRRFNNPDGSFAGVILATISIDSLVKMFAEFDLGKYGVITLRDADLEVIARHPVNQGKSSTIGSKTVSKEFRDLVQKGEVAGTYATPGSIDSLRRTFSFRKLAQHPFYVNAGRSSRDYLTGWYYEVWKTGVLCLLFALGTLFSARIMFQKWKQNQQAEISLQRHNAQLENQVAERTSELNSANIQLMNELAERTIIEDALKFQKRHLRTIIETEPDCVKLLDRNGALLMMNTAGVAMIQAESFDEIKGTYAYNLVDPEHRQAFIQATNDAFEGRSGTFTFKMNGLKGTSMWMESHVAPLRNEQGDIDSVVGITRDITERKVLEASLQQSLLRFHSMSDAAGAYLWEIGTDMVYTYVSGQSAM